MGQIKFIGEALKWRDKVNGNTYHSVRITRTDDGKVIACPFQYGYDEHYRQTALEAMAKAGWLPKKYCTPAKHGGLIVYLYERENDYPIHWSVSDALKREVEAHGRE